MAQTDIGHLGGGSAQVNAVAEGFVVGNSTIPGGDRHAFVWSAATGTMTDIGALLPGSPYSSATSVNSTGEVVGGYWVPDVGSSAFYWSQTTGIRTISAVGNFGESPPLINENGVVAGVDANGHVFRWTLAGGLEDLGVTGAAAHPGDTYVSGINVQGDIVGHSGRGSRGYAVGFIAYGSASSLTLLHSPGISSPPPIAEIHGGNVNIQINGINDNGVVIGAYWDFSYIYSGYAISQGGFFNASVHNSHAFKWTLADGFTDLGNFGNSYLVPGSPATFGASANAINNAGEIVGSSFLPTGGYAPFIYKPVTGLTQLPGQYAGDNAASATGINDDGVVVGYANGLATAAMWKNGVFTSLTPSFAPQWPYWPFIKGSTIGGNGLDGSWNGHAWAFMLPPVTKVFASGTATVTTWDPIFPGVAYPIWQSQCTAAPSVGPDANWVNPHAAFSFPLGSHPWEGIVPYNFAANWINAWSNLSSQGPSGQSWTKYSTTVTGAGDFVVQFLADNCSWIYLDDQLIGVQDDNWQTNGTGRYPVTLTGAGPHTLSFIILDGGGAAGGKFRLETRQSFIDGGGDPGDLTPPKAPSTTTVSFGVGPFVYTGDPFVATASVSPTGVATIAYSGDCTNAGSTCTATATYPGDATHLGSSDTASITIDRAPTTTTVSFSQPSYVYSGSAIVATASAGATIAYSGSCTDVGTCTATATNPGDANHFGSSASASAEITPASSATTVTFGAGPFVYTGSAFTATSTVSPSGTATIAYSGDCVNGGTTCSATATYAGDLNHFGSSQTASIAITYAVCGGSSGAGPAKQSGSTIPVKIRACNAQGQNVSSSSLSVRAMSLSPAASLNDSGKANPGNLFRLTDDATYLFNLSTKGLSSGSYMLNYTIGNDPTVYQYAFGIK